MPAKRKPAPKLFPTPPPLPVADASGQKWYDHPYGLKFPYILSERDLEAVCFINDWRVEDGGLGKYRHFKNFQKLVWPDVEWNPWLEDQIESLCNEDYAVRVNDSVSRTIVWTGCGSAGKTFAAGFYASLWWNASPHNSIVVLTSTTKEMIGKRVWPVVQWFFHNAKCPKSGQKLQCGHMIESRKMVQFQKGDEKHAIFALAVAHGETSKAAENLKGMHAPRILLIIDEANKTPEAIFETIKNMKKGCRDFTCLIIGNPVSRLDNHGRAAEPRDGWGSVTVEDEIWPTGGVPEWELDSGLCCHYDGAKSPNVKKQQTIYKHIFSWEDYRRAISSGNENSVGFWSQTRGFWCPDGTRNTVLSETMIDKYDAKGQFVFLSTRKPVASLDSGFGGDACIAQFGLVGDVSGAKAGIQLTEWLEIKPKVNSKDEIDYQIARRFIEECKRRGVQPRNAGVLATGTGRGVYAIVATEWSSEVLRIEEGGAPSDMPASEDNPKPAKEVYDRKVTELWYSVREFVKAEQIKGLYHEAIVQFCTREYEDDGKKVKIDPKDICKEKLGRSPDHADAIAALVHVAREGGLRPAGKLAVKKSDSWQRLLRETSSVYDSPYAEENDFSMTIDV